jgi:thiomorpholine-carboxylate dehydrogenase
MRTAAVSAAATKYLMPENSRVLAVLGSGAQARAHVEALAHIAEFAEIRVWSRTPEHARRFAEEHGAIVMDVQAAVRDADVMVVATSSQAPVLRGAWLKPGAHVNAVGANRPTWRELDDAVMANTLLVDSRASAAQESGDVMLSKASIYAEIGELFAGNVAAPPRSTTTVFKSLGLAVEDLPAAKLVLELMAR